MDSQLRLWTLGGYRFIFPSLWFRLTINFICADSCKNAPALLETIFLHSHSHPLDINISTWCPQPYPSPCMQAFSVVLQHCRRWRHVVLRIELYYLKETNIVKGNLPLLESLLLMDLTESQYSPRKILPESDRTIFSSAPRLHKVALYKMHGLGDLELPRHVTHLAGCTTDLYRLETYQFLEECHLDTSMIPQDISHPNPISLLRLRRLYVDSTSLLRHLHLPSLQHLTLELVRVTSVLSDQDAFNLNDLLRRSHCQLDSLAVGPGMVSCPTFIQQSLSMMQSLLCLDITLRSTEDSFFNALTASLAILPDLQRLHLRQSTGVDLTSWNSLTSMIDSRRHTSSFHVIRVIAASKYAVDSVNDQFIPYQEDGFDVTVGAEEPQELDGARITLARLENSV
ncbi:uncharacterized protein EV420DRAFT_761567 [Desarmillaria tabescens]|uniref:F-box domain-containing protein n=1 Tax=Armillaria tabescens TaxID=1929756 RepID=A0AA39JXP2_ARMTA|nr:uncharacterized protein EV420DRAFT_761567 [Desarmillaria tabescens]KAK0449726.1 hypothetical protein EV420DRAFT_761567 [Desarmillaria tabescens]